MVKNLFESGDAVVYGELLCRVLEVIQFGNFWIYDVQEIEHRSEFYGVDEDELRHLS